MNMLYFWILSQQRKDQGTEDEGLLWIQDLCILNMSHGVIFNLEKRALNRIRVCKKKQD